MDYQTLQWATFLYNPAPRPTSIIVPLQAGMSLTADIKLRERRFINIFTGFFEDQRRNLERLR